MNPSEIAERYAREIVSLRDDDHIQFVSDSSYFCICKQCDKTRAAIIERAIEESRGQHPVMGCESCGKPPTEHFCSREVNFEYYTEPKEVMPVERAGQKSLSQVRNSDIAGDASAKTRAEDGGQPDGKES